MSRPYRTRVFAWCLSPIVLALAACGGSGGAGDGSASLTGKSIAGTVVDAAFESARLSCLSADRTVASGWSGQAGEYRFDLPPGDRCEVVEARGGIAVGVAPDDPSQHTDRPALVRRAPVPPGDAPADKVVLSPLSTLVQALIDRGVPLDEARVRVREALGLPASAGVLDTDPAADLELARASHLVDQVVGQTAAAIAAAGGIGDPESMQAITLIVYDTLAAALPQLGRGALAPEVTTLSADTPLIGFIQSAFAAARASPGVGPLLANADPEMLASVAGPGVADSGGVLGSADAADLADRVREMAQSDRAAVLIGEYGLSLIPVEASAGVVERAGGCVASSYNPPRVRRVDNVAGLVCDQIALLTAGSPDQTVSVQQFQSPGVALTRHFSAYQIELKQLGSQTQFVKPRTGQFAIEITDVGRSPQATRTFQAIIDKVVLRIDGNRIVSASIPDGARLYVYGRTGSAITNRPIQIDLRTAFSRGIVTTVAAPIRIQFSLDRLLELIDGAVGGNYLSAPTGSSALQFLVDNRVSSGRYSVKMVISNTRIAYGNPVDLAPVQSVTMRSTCSNSSSGLPICTSAFRTVSGYGFQGFVDVVAPAP